MDFKLVDPSLKLYRGQTGSPNLPQSLYYLLTLDETPPDPLPFATAWRQKSGAYVFLPGTGPIPDPAAFVAALRKLLLQPTPQSQWIAWIPSPHVVDGTLADVRLLTAAKQIGEDVGRIIAGGARLAFGNLSLVVQAETLVGADTAATPPALWLAGKPDIGSSLALAQGTQRTLDLPPETKLTIPFDQQQIGAWTFPLSVNRGAFYQLFQPPDDFSTPPSAEARYSFSDGGTQRQIRYPALLGALQDPRNPPQALLPMRVAIDPLSPTDFVRTRFALDLPAYVPGGPELPTSLSFRTTAGHTVRLQPLEGAGFGLARGIDTAGPAPSLYLAPAGPFQATSKSSGDAAVAGPPIAEGAMLILCGLYGTEFLLAAEEDRLELQGERPANATAFPGSPAAGKPVIDGAYGTGWVKLFPGPKSGQTFKGAVKQSYCVQAADSVYFQRSAGSGFPFPMALGARLGDLADTAKTGPFPMAPYGWVYYSDPDTGIENPNPGITGATMTDYENQVISLARRQAIAVDRCLGPLFFNLANLEALAGGYVQTPQGLLVELNDGGDPKRPAGTWKRLILARGPQDPDQLLSFDAGTQPSGCTGSQGPYEVVSPLLSTALLSGAPFVVVTRPEPLGRFQSAVRLGEFPFRIDVSGASQGATLGTNTVLVFKLAAGRSFKELAAAPSAWTDAATFVGDAGQVQRISTQIQSYIADAQKLSDEARKAGAFDYFAGFLRRVKSPGWSGVLALNAPLDLKTLPTDLKALLGGMVPGHPLRGHHFGINLNELRLDTPAGELPLTKSSLFALVHYDEDLRPPTAEFDFQVLKLNALFDNSTLERFESQIAFSVKTLFGDRTRMIQGGENDQLATNTIVIDGALQVQDGQTSVVFATSEIRVFDFPTPNGAFRALSRLAVDQASLNPVGERPAGDAVIVDSSFVFNGALVFSLVPVTGSDPADLFSFGKADDPTDGLGYSAYDF
ncbi:MAG TPA: hypothetical protein VFC23_00555, partial [Thermoanaerobaculia bacterium]|nr:hypothetical protein [Thermoanaerobaculia bacterium]